MKDSHSEIASEVQIITEKLQLTLNMKLLTLFLTWILLRGAPIDRLPITIGR